MNKLARLRLASTAWFLQEGDTVTLYLKGGDTYSFAVDEKNVETEPHHTVPTVRLTGGSFGARINITHYTDLPEISVFLEEVMDSGTINNAINRVDFSINR